MEILTRIHRQLPGEEYYIGEHILGNPHTQLAIASNRELLLEFCVANEIFVANTFIEHPAHRQATFRNVGVPPDRPIDKKNYAQLDLFLARLAEASSFTHIRSLPEPLASHHFVVIASLSESLIPMPTSRETRQRVEASSLRDPKVARRFADVFESSLAEVEAVTPVDIDERCRRCDEVFRQAAELTLPKLRS